jgi:hypothetical protein
MKDDKTRSMKDNRESSYLQLAAENARRAAEAENPQSKALFGGLAQQYRLMASRDASSVGNQATNVGNRSSSRIRRRASPAGEPEHLLDGMEELVRNNTHLRIGL